MASNDKKSDILLIKFSLSILIIFWCSLIGNAQPYELWNKTFGGFNDLATSVQQTSDDGYMIAGYTNEINYDTGWIIKTDAKGEQIWRKTFDNGYIESAQQTSDGGYILGGSTYTGVGGHYLLIKLDPNGNQIWRKEFDNGSVSSLEQTSDGGYILGGTIDQAGFPKAFLAKIDDNGNQLWIYNFNAEFSYFNSVRQTSDGGYIIAGSTSGALLVKTDSNGREQWSKTFNITLGNMAQSVQQTTDGGYIFTGYGYSNIILVKTDENGNQQWSNIFGKHLGDFGNSVQQTSDGGYIIAGSIAISDDKNGWLIRTDSRGNKVWDKTFGGSGEDNINSIQKTSDGGYILAGSTSSYGTGTSNAWLIKISSESATTSIESVIPTVTQTSTAIPLNEGKGLPQLMGVILILAGLVFTALTTLKKEVVIQVGISEKSLNYVGGAGMMLIIIGAYVLLKSFNLL